MDTELLPVLKDYVALKLDASKVKPEGAASWNPALIKWQPTEGFKGLYDRYPAEGQKPEATSDCKNLLLDLKAHEGHLYRDGYFYWVFSDASTVGRKKKAKS